MFLVLPWPNNTMEAARFGSDELIGGAMKKLLLTLMLALVSSSAMAEWTLVERSASQTAYVDFATIRKVDDVAKMWCLLDFKKKQGNKGKEFLSLKVQSEYDCKEEQSRSLAIIGFSKNMGYGKPDSSGSYPTDWQPVAPESNDLTFWQIACGKK